MLLPIAWLLLYLLKQNVIISFDSHFFISIHNFETQWKTTDPIWLAYVASKMKKNVSEIVDNNDDEKKHTFIIDTGKNLILR